MCLGPLTSFSTWAHENVHICTERALFAFFGVNAAYATCMLDDLLRKKHKGIFLLKKKKRYILYM